MGDNTAETAAKLSYVLHKLADDLPAADLQLSLFVAAVSSYRHDTTVRPFPPMFMREVNSISTDKRDIANLVRVMEKLPRLTSLLRDPPADVGDLITIDLLHWLLNKKQLTLKSCSPDVLPEFSSMSGHRGAPAAPNYVFEVVYEEVQRAKFDDLRAGRDVIHAYHGSSVENFYSIFNFGLQGHFSKNALFGEGTYLTSELSMAIGYAAIGKAWEQSMLGDRLSCIALCEIIDDPSVKCQVKDRSPSGSQGRVSGSIGGAVPEKYYVVRNNDVIRLKYILAYAECSKVKSMQLWVQRHKFVVALVLYAVLLVAIAVYNSRGFRAWLRRNRLF